RRESGLCHVRSSHRGGGALAESRPAALDASGALWMETSPAPQTWGSSLTRRRLQSSQSAAPVRGEGRRDGPWSASLIAAEFVVLRSLAGASRERQLVRHYGRRSRMAPKSPTAQTSLAPLPQTPQGKFVVPLEALVQALPFQCRMVPSASRPLSSGTRCRIPRRREWDCPGRRARGGTSRPGRSRRRGG